MFKYSIHINLLRSDLPWVVEQFWRDCKERQLFVGDCIHIPQKTVHKKIQTLNLFVD